MLTSILDDVGNAATPVANGGITNDAQPTLSGTAEAGSTVKIFDNGVQIGSVIATGGAWSYTPSPALGNGPHTLTFTATDATGNASAPTAGYTINVDTLAPAAPVISSVIDDVGSVIGPVTGTTPTNDTRPALSGPPKRMQRYGSTMASRWWAPSPPTAMATGRCRKPPR